MESKSILFTNSDLNSALKSFKRGKACGVDGLAAKHFIYAHSITHVFLSLLFNAFIRHGYLPTDFIKTAIVPIIKNKTGDTSDKNNYRPIALVTATSKLFEICLYLKFYKCTLLHMTTSLDLKQNTLLDMCIFTVKSIIKYYTGHNTPVYTCFLDASKAFDRVNHWTLFTKLIYSGISLLIVRILVFWYQTQQLCITWGWFNFTFFYNLKRGTTRRHLIS